MARKGARSRYLASYAEPHPGEDAKWSTARVLIVFAIAALVTLLAGVVLEESSNAMAGQLGLSGVLFGSTVLAAATALPEVSTGLASVNIGDYQLAVSDIFGGNAFLPRPLFASHAAFGASGAPRKPKTPTSTSPAWACS